MNEDDMEEGADEEDDGGSGRDARCGRGAAVTLVAVSALSCSILHGAWEAREDVIESHIKNNDMQSRI